MSSLFYAAYWLEVTLNQISDDQRQVNGSSYLADAGPGAAALRRPLLVIYPSAACRRQIYWPDEISTDS